MDRPNLAHPPDGCKREGRGTGAASLRAPVPVRYRERSGGEPYAPDGGTFRNWYTVASAASAKLRAVSHSPCVTTPSFS